MQAAQLDTLKTKAVYAEAVAFIARLVAAGVPLANITASNFESARNSQVDSKGKFPGRQVIVIPNGKEGKTSAWKATAGFSPRNASRLIEAAGFPKEMASVESVEVVQAPKVPAASSYVPMGYAPTLDSSNVVRNPLKINEAREKLATKFQMIRRPLHRKQVA